MLCNLNEKCITVKDTCQDQTTGANELKKRNLKLLLAEFETNLNVNKDVINNKIEDALNSANNRIEVLRNLRISNMYKYELKKIAIANTLEAGVDVITSPYDGLLSAIFGQADVAKRYLDISNFAATFTREYVADNAESPYWLYCIKTNKKMLPTFIHKLALTFLKGDNFNDMLDRICAEQGTISEDGDKWVDKYSGYTIKMIELNADEEYNEEGFKIVTRAVMEADAGEAIMQAASQAPGQAPGQALMGAPRKYSTPDANKIYNVIESMSNNMGIIIEDQKDFIVRNVLKQISNTSVMPSKSAYEKILALAVAKGKTMDNYEKAYNSTLLYLTLAYFLIGIQISIPPIKTKTTFPGCKKSFSGFPIDGSDNMKGLTYVSCVAQKMINPANLPWSAITNRSSAFIAKQIEANITKFILQTEDVQNGIKELQLYLSTNPDISIPEEHNLVHWSNFLPPLKTLKMTTVQDVGDVFKSRLSDSLKKGTANQFDYILELQSKMISFSFNIIDLIEQTVHGEQAILKNNSGEPFVENACCEVNENNTLQYFIKKQPEIAVLNNKVVRLSDMYADTKRISKAAILYNPSNTKRIIKDVGQQFSEDTIYRAFIVYCKFNSLIPISENLKAICPTKPDDFNVNDSLEESIRKLKSNARNYNEKSLQQLLDVINSNTKQAIKIEDKQLTNAIKLNEIMTKIDAENIRPSVFRAAFMDVLENFELNDLMEDTSHMRKFKNVLAKLNDDMQRQVIEFVAETGATIKGTIVNEFKECIKTIMQFKETGDNMFLNKKDETGYKMINFMKKAMRCLSKEFPNIIINSINYANSAFVPSHWKLSKVHNNDVKEIIKKHYSELNRFYGDEQIVLLMEKLMSSTEDINELAQNTLMYAPVEIHTKHASAGASIGAGIGAGAGKNTSAVASKSMDASNKSNSSESISSNTRSSEGKKSLFKYSAFDLELTTLLFQFYFISVLSDLISFKSDVDILQVPLLKLQELSSEDENLFMDKAAEMDVLVGNQAELSEKIVRLLVSFTNLICKDKRAIDYNYNSLMDLIMRSKEKEKDEITDYFKEMSIEEREVENLFKMNKLGRWSKGEQKGIHTYDTNTYDQEREEMEQMALREARLNKRSIVTDMNRNIFELEMISEENNNDMLDKEDNIITYMGEDAEPEDYDMDGDENF
jgi:hypothetical protein